MFDHHRADFVSIPWLHTVLLLLAGVSGSIDAMGYLRLGHVLTANMTGNTVLLGIAIGEGKFASVMKSFTALLGFILGVAAGSLLVQGKRKGWFATFSFSLTLEFFLILVMAILWLRFIKPNENFALFSCIILSAIAMGLQSATIRHLHIPGVVTTYISGTITVVVSELAQNFGKILRRVFHPKTKGLPEQLEKRIGLQLLIFITYAGIAAVTALIYGEGMGFLPLLPLTLILIVIVIVRGRPDNLQQDHRTEGPALARGVDRS